MAALINFRPADKPSLNAGEGRYRGLLGEAAWARLPEVVRRRFSRRLGRAEQIVYRGEVVAMELSRCGWLLAQAARLVGAPLPYTRDALGPCMVVVTEAEALGGQLWCRSYARDDWARGRARLPQVIQSVKRFAGPTGIEEYLGMGLVMRLTLHEDRGQLVFRSAGYAFEVAGWRVELPGWLSPGHCTVSHRAETDARFSFTLSLDHPWLGRLVHQVAFFEEERA